MRFPLFKGGAEERGGGFAGAGLRKSQSILSISTMKITKKQYITDAEGNKIAVILPIKKYKRMLEDLEMKEDVALYDKAKADDDGERIDFDDYVTSRKSKKSA